MLLTCKGDGRHRLGHRYLPAMCVTILAPTGHFVPVFPPLPFGLTIPQTLGPASLSSVPGGATEFLASSAGAHPTVIREGPGCAVSWPSFLLDTRGCRRTCPRGPQTLRLGKKRVGVKDQSPGPRTTWCNTYVPHSRRSSSGHSVFPATDLFKCPEPLSRQLTATAVISPLLITEDTHHTQNNRRLRGIRRICVTVNKAQPALRLENNGFSLSWARRNRFYTA